MIKCLLNLTILSFTPFIICFLQKKEKFPQMKKIETIIFDLGKVLIDWEPRRLYRKIFDDEKKMETFLKKVCTSDWNIEQDRGRSLEEATNILVEKFPKQEKEIKAFYGRWEEMLGGPVQSTVDILEYLYKKQSHKLYALTNWSAETFPVAQRDYYFLKYFEGILVSGDEKLIKPDPKIYKLMLKRYKIRAGTALFIDDSLKNVKGAKACGIRAIHFKDGDSLKKELVKLKVL